MPRQESGEPDRAGRWFAARLLSRQEGRLTSLAPAAKEASGEVAPDPVGSYGYVRRLPGGRVLPCDVHVFPLRVARVLDDWPERRQRERRWFTLAGAAMAVEEGGLMALLLRLAAPGA